MISVEELARKRGWACEICHVPTRALSRHHCFYHRMKKHPELDAEQNLQLVCIPCHHSTANSRNNQLTFWQVQKGRYDMTKWHNSLPLKIKERFE